MEAIREPQLNPSDSRQKSPVRKSSCAAVSRQDLLRFVMALMPLRKSSPQSWDRKLVGHLMQVEHLWHGQQRKRTESRLHKQWTARYTVQSALWRRNFKPRLKVQISENSSEKFVGILLVYNKILDCGLSSDYRCCYLMAVYANVFYQCTASKLRNRYTHQGRGCPL